MGGRHLGALGHQATHPRLPPHANGTRAAARRSGMLAPVRRRRRLGPRREGAAGMSAWLRYFSFFRRNPRADAAEEVRFHLEMRIRDHIARGLSPADARRAAEAEFGNSDRVVDEVALIDTRIDDMTQRIETIAVLKQDTIFALRQMRARPTAAAAIVLTLALGIGATTSIFSVVNRVLL